MHYELTQLVLPSLGTVGRCSLSERNEESNGSGEVSQPLHPFVNKNPTTANSISTSFFFFFFVFFFILFLVLVL